MVDPILESIFPGLRGQVYSVTSPIDPKYNCIAWAAGDTKNWWWPSAAGKEFWPGSVARERTIEAFRDTFATLGYADCDDETLECERRTKSAAPCRTKSAAVLSADPLRSKPPLALTAGGRSATRHGHLG